MRRFAKKLRLTRSHETAAHFSVILVGLTIRPAELTAEALVSRKTMIKIR